MWKKIKMENETIAQREKREREQLPLDLFGNTIKYGCFFLGISAAVSEPRDYITMGLAGVGCACGEALKSLAPQFYRKRLEDKVQTGSRK